MPSSHFNGPAPIESIYDVEGISIPDQGDETVGTVTGRFLNSIQKQMKDFCSKHKLAYRRRVQHPRGHLIAKSRSASSSSSRRDGSPGESLVAPSRAGPRLSRLQFVPRAKKSAADLRAAHEEELRRQRDAETADRLLALEDKWFDGLHS